jgi:hypothetical protein
MTHERHAAPTQDDAAVQDFASRMRGELIQPGDVGYEQARKLYNAMIDKRPALIARCADIADVISAVGFARKHRSPWPYAAAGTTVLAWLAAMAGW